MGRPKANWAIGLVLIRKWANGGVCRSKARIEGKTVLITGANIGIGLETARDMARRGARVLIKAKGTTAVKDIRESTGNKDVHLYILDLASLESVRQCAKELLKEESRLDILINNAGIMACPKALSKDGYELQFATNHLGHFLLTNLLLDLLKRSAPSRIVNVSSLGHMGKFSDPNFTRLGGFIYGICTWQRDCAEKKSATKLVQDDDTAKKLWDVSVKMTEL